MREREERRTSNLIKMKNSMPYLIVSVIILIVASSEHVNASPFGAVYRDAPPYTIAAFAVGGFGRSKSSKKKKTSKKKKSVTPTTNLLTPQGRMDHIRSRIAQATVSPMNKLSLQPTTSGDTLSLEVDPNNICVIDNFLGKDLITAMRAEAESLLPTMVPSMSTRWDEETQSVVPYEKVGVYSTQIEGGEEGYKATPRLVEYIVTLTANLSHKLNQILPETHQLSEIEQTNKLAVCMGDGSLYDKHIDNLGGGDRRKLTALLYLQPPGSHDGQPDYPNENVKDDARGGYFRAYDVPERGDVTCIAPRGDRLVMFWSDSLVHDVSPSFCSNGSADHRYALTIWFVVTEKGVIRSTNAETEQVHFGTG